MSHLPSVKNMLYEAGATEAETEGARKFLASSQKKAREGAPGCSQLLMYEDARAMVPLLQDQISALQRRVQFLASQVNEKEAETKNLTNRIEALKVDFQEKLQLVTVRTFLSLLNLFPFWDTKQKSG